MKPTSIADNGSTSLQVLIVDDNKDAATTLAMLLDYRGYETAVAQDCASAIALAINFHPDAILLDIAMPGMNGFHVAKTIRQTPVISNALIIGISGYSVALTRGEDGNVFDSQLLKPVSLAHVDKLLKSNCARNGWSTPI